MTSKRTATIVVGLLALAASAVLIRERLASIPAVPRATQPLGTVLGHEVVGEYPHDADAFTQGLVFLDGFLYESTGITGRSSLRMVRLETGEVIRQRADMARATPHGGRQTALR